MSVPNNAVTDHNIHDDYVKNPPNVRPPPPSVFPFPPINLLNPYRTSCFRTLTEQSRIHDLVGTEGTEVVSFFVPSLSCSISRAGLEREGIRADLELRGGTGERRPPECGGEATGAGARGPAQQVTRSGGKAEMGGRKKRRD